MNVKERKIRDGLIHIAKLHGPDYLVDGTVTAVDEENYLCDVELDTGGTIYECRLRAVAAENQSIDILPGIGSAVVIGKLLDDDYLVLAIDEITSYRITVGNMIYTIDENGFKLSNGTDTLKSIMSDLVDQILEIYAPKDIAAIGLIKARIAALLA